MARMARSARLDRNGPVKVKAISPEHVFAALEPYFKSMSLMDDDEILSGFYPEKGTDRYVIEVSKE